MFVPGCVFAARQYLSAGPYTDKSQLPTKFKIDACTLDCPACPAKEFLKKHNHFGYLKFKDFKKFVDENTVTQVELSNSGEIFLNPELLDIIKYAHKKNITLTAYGGVNGNTITDEMLEALVKYRFQHLYFSIDGAGPDVYALYRRGGDFNKVIANIKKINEYKAKYNSEFPLMTWQYVIFGHNVCDMRKAKQMAQDLGMELTYNANCIWWYSPVTDWKDKMFVKSELRKSKTFNFFAKESPASVICPDIFSFPQIGFDGRLRGCACNADTFYKTNVFKEGLMKALNHPDFVYTRKMLTGQAPEKEGIPCATCYKYQAMKKEGVWVSPKV